MKPGDKVICIKKFNYSMNPNKFIYPGHIATITNDSNVYVQLDYNIEIDFFDINDFVLSIDMKSIHNNYLFDYFDTQKNIREKKLKSLENKNSFPYLYK